MSLDHGILNLPLRKRGDIDSQIDAHKAREASESARRHKSLLAIHRARVADAKKLVGLLPDSRLAELGAPHGMTAKQTRRQMLSLAQSKPDLCVQVMEREPAAIAALSGDKA